MSWTQVCCQYDGTYPGFLSCVFDCYVNREEPVEFRAPEDMCCSLYPLRTVVTDQAHARRVYRSFAKFGPEGQRLAIRCFLTCLPDKELWLWRFLRLSYEQGARAAQSLTDPTVDKVRKAVLRLEGEAHLYKGFVRFSDFDGTLAGEIEPKNRVLPLLRPHFCGRYPQERFVLHDRTHGEALFHRPGPKSWAILPVEGFSLNSADSAELAYRTLWRTFYDTIAIEGRYNPKCRMTHMPKRYWTMMTEFQRDEGPRGGTPASGATRGARRAERSEFRAEPPRPGPPPQGPVSPVADSSVIEGFPQITPKCEIISTANANPL